MVQKLLMGFNLADGNKAQETTSASFENHGTFIKSELVLRMSDFWDSCFFFYFVFIVEMDPSLWLIQPLLLQK